jgi:AbiV family abortive infection protein
MKKERDQELSIPELRQAYHAAISQSESLHSEGRLLLANKRHSGAFHRFVIALEELGKARLTMYQAAFLAAKAPVDWRHFWRSYFSHVEKLRLGLLWYETPSLLQHKTAEAVEGAFLAAEKQAAEMDRLKQDSSYSGPKDGTFLPTNEDEHSTRARRLRTVVAMLIRRIKRHKATKTSAENFEVTVRGMHQLANVLGYLKADSKEFFEAWTKANIPFRVRDGHLPTDRQFVDRVRERYSEIPPKLGVTLPALRKSGKFRSFYDGLKQAYGYPDWVLLGVIFNLALNARLGLENLRPEEIKPRTPSILAWTEDPQKDGPLDVAVFTDPERFDLALDAWMISFLVGLGISPEPPDGSTERVRHLAVQYYGFFNRDVKHEPIFNFSKADEGS